jgi:ComF family protein
MFDIPTKTVNFELTPESTIRRGLSSARLPLWYRFSYRLLTARCILCEASGDLGAIDLCATCLRALPWDRSVQSRPQALFDYRPAVSRGLIALKFAADFRQAAVWGTLLGASWRAIAYEVPPLIVPVPLHRSRLRERGFNQVAMLARYASRVSGWPVAPHLLERHRATAPQTRLDGASRHLNVRDAFSVGRPPSPNVSFSHAIFRARTRQARLPTIILLDDVVTTGATLQAAAGVLEQAGYCVHPWAVARAIPTKITSPMV